MLEEIINNENFVFQETDDNILLLKQNMLKLSMNSSLLSILSRAFLIVKGV